MIVRMTMIVAVATLAATNADAQGLSPYYGPQQQYAPPSLPLDIIAPERPRGTSRQRNAAPPIAVVPLDPPAAGTNTRSTGTGADGARREQATPAR